MQTFEQLKPIVVKKLEENNEEHYNKTINHLEKYSELANKALKLSPNNKKVLSAIEYIKKEKSSIKKGHEGEKSVLYYLENSNIPMYILHGVYLKELDNEEKKNNKNNGVQIDYIVITQRNIYVIECKNWSGNLLVNRRGDFEADDKGVKNPYTQNEIHLNNVKEKLNANSNFFFNYNNILHSIIVFSNPEMLIEINEAVPKEIESKIVKADMLGYYIKHFDEEYNNEFLSYEEMDELSNYFCQISSENPNNFLEKLNWLERFVVRKKLLRITSSFLLVFTSLFYMFYFYKFQTPKLMADASSSDLWIALKEIFMVYSPLGIASGIIGFISGLLKKTESSIATFGSVLQCLITVLTITWSIIIDPPNSFFGYAIELTFLVGICFIWNITDLIFFNIGKLLSKPFFKELEQETITKVFDE